MTQSRSVLWWLVPTAILMSACLCSRGPVEEDTTVVVEESSERLSAKIEYDFFRGRLKSYDSPIYNRKATTQEELDLWVTVPGLDQPKRLKLRRESNKEDEAPLGSITAELRLDPAGERVAYRLSDGDWELVYVTTSVWLLQAESGVLGGEPPAEDWAGVPTLRASLVSLLRAHDFSDGIYEMANRGRLFTHLSVTLKEPELVDVLVETSGLVSASDTSWSLTAGDLSPENQTLLGVRLRAKLEQKLDPFVLKRAAAYMDLDDPGAAELAHDGARILIENERLRAWSRKAQTRYLFAAVRHDPERASKTACELLGDDALGDFFSRPGRSTRLGVLTAIASFEGTCPAVQKLLPEDPCAEGWAKPSGERFTEEELRGVIERQLGAELVTGDGYRKEEDPQFVLAAITLSAEELPDVFTKACASSPAK